MEDLPLIVKIKRHSLEDGPGIRSVVFFKGCPLRCVFCHNPETQDPLPEIAFFARECIGCGACAGACPQGAIELEHRSRIRRDQCVRCGACADACPAGSLRRIGTAYSVEALTEILLRDLSFYRHSGGGVTLSGGEPTMWPGYVGDLLKGLKAKGVHVVLETSGFFDWDEFEEAILPYLDLVYYDVKLADSEGHRKHVGTDNRGILGNLRRLLREDVEVHPRIPVVPGITATRENLSAIVDLLCEIGAPDISLLPYNPLGLEMYANLGRPKPPLPEAFMKPEQEDEIRAFVADMIRQKGGGPRRIDSTSACSDSLVARRTCGKTSARRR